MEKEFEYADAKGRFGTVSEEQLEEDTGEVFAELGPHDKFETFSGWCYDREFVTVSTKSDFE